MKLFCGLFYLLFFTLSEVIAEISSIEFDKLLDSAHLSSFAYCLKRGLTEGKLGDEATKCVDEKCKLKPYEDIFILKTFNYEGWGAIGSGYYAIDHNQKRIILVFRGTASTADWLNNANIFPVDYTPIAYLNNKNIEQDNYMKCKGCLVHKGFYNFLQNNCTKIIKEVMKVKDSFPEYSLLVTGHSLGAALTLLSGIELQISGYEPLVISFGGPKIGNKKMMNFIDKIFSTSELDSDIDDKSDFTTGYIRVAHKGDVIPKLPPGNLYRQSGYQYYIDKKSLPQDQDDVVRKGMKLKAREDENKEQSVEFETNFSPGKLWPDALGKLDHINYLIKITECRS